jgi:O-methyltransferase
MPPTSTEPTSSAPLRRKIRRLRHPLSLAGERLFVRQAEAALRYKTSERFGYEIPHRREFFRHAFHYLRFNAITGDYAEFGSHGAFTFRLAWGASELVGHDCTMWAFDSFEGLPDQSDSRDEHPRWTPGTMSTSLAEFHRLCRQAGIPEDRYSAVAGYYSSTLVDQDAPRPEQVAFAYVDCDLYSSTREVLTFLETRLRPGGIVAFDDYYCYAPEGPSGERLAAKHHFGGESRWTLVPYIQYGWAGMSFVLENRELGLGADSAW